MRTDELGAPSVCYGYALRSPMALYGLRAGEGIPLTVTEEETEPSSVPSSPPLREWRNELVPFVRLWGNDGSYKLWVEHVGWYEVDPARPAIAAPRSSDGPLREVRLLGIPMALCLMHRGDLALHAAGVDVDGRAVLLAAPGRHGKTTLAAAFIQAGYRLLSEDMTCLRALPEPVVFPGPAYVRLRRDVVDHLDLPGAEPAAEYEDRVLVTLAGHGDGRAVPVGALVFLRPGDGETVFTRRTLDAALPDLWCLTLKLSDTDRVRCFQGLTAFASRVPIWDLQRKLSFDDLPSVVESIVTTCLK
jgi:hypothetical protein